MTEKAILILLFLGGVGLYAFLNHRKVRYYLNRALDERVPFLALFVIPYIGLFPFVILMTVFLVRTSVAMEFLVAIVLAMYTASLVWYLFPTGVRRPKLRGKYTLESVVKWVYAHDDSANAFPSSHVFTALITSYYGSLAFPEFSLVLWPIGVAIALSTVFVKQHYLADVLGGVFWVIGAIAISSYLV